MELIDGECAVFLGNEGGFQRGINSEYSFPYAKADSIIVGKNGPILEAHGGDCRVVAFFQKEIRLGALMHIDAADIFTDRHEELIDTLFSAIPEISHADTHVLICGDIDDVWSPVLLELREARKDWHQRIKKCLSERKLERVEEILSGCGKHVKVFTRKCLAKILNNKGKLIKKIVFG
ncbi:MAG: hypothetical protein HOO67_05410 [Candidatus Peribacteraceae bacterium]|nr:hypothetical protein [Candidatus Peribacteraceae bacterium]